MVLLKLKICSSKLTKLLHRLWPWWSHSLSLPALVGSIYQGTNAPAVIAALTFGLLPALTSLQDRAPQTLGVAHRRDESSAATTPEAATGKEMQHKENKQSKPQQSQMDSLIIQPTLSSTIFFHLKCEFRFWEKRTSFYFLFWILVLPMITIKTAVNLKGLFL